MQLNNFQSFARFAFVKTVTIVLLLVCVPALAELSVAEKKLLLGAFDQKPNELNEGCAYTQTVQQIADSDDELNETVISRYDAFLRPESPWKVVSVNVRPPTEEEQRNFEPNLSHPALGGGFIDPNALDKLDLVSKHNDIWTFEAPVEEMGNTLAVETQITGFGTRRFKLVFEMHAPTVTPMAIKVVLKKPFRFRLITRIAKVEMAILFGTVPNIDGSVIREMNMEMRARAFGKHMSYNLNTAFSDFDCSGSNQILNEENPVQLVD